MFRNKYFFPVVIIGIIFFGVFLRFWQLGTIPPGVHYDEAYNGVNALAALENHNFQIFYSDNTGREGFHINTIAFFISLFGNNNWGLRVANALWGSLTLIGFFFLLKELKFSRLSILLGTFIISTSFWHIVFSRTAYRAIMVPFVLVWMFYFLWRGINCSLQYTPLSLGEGARRAGEGNNQRYRYLYFVLSGLFLGLGFHTYIAFRVAPVILVAVIFSFFVTGKINWKKHWKIWLAFLIAASLVVLPMLLYFSTHWRDLIFRMDSVSVFNSPRYTFTQAFTKSLSAHLMAFFEFGDHNPRHNYNSQPLLPHVWAVLFALGFIISGKEIIGTIKKKLKAKKIAEKFYPTKLFYVSVLAQSMFWVMLMPGVLSIEGIPHSLRIIGTIPAVFILSLLPIEYLVSFYRDIRTREDAKKQSYMRKLNTLLVGIIFLIIFAGFSQVYTYFYVWSKDVATQGAYERKLYDLGLLIKDLPLKKNNYIITSLNTGIFFDHHQSSLKTTEFVGYPNSKQYLFYLPMDGFKEINCEDPLIVFLESDQWLRDRYREKCPDLKAKRYQYDNGKYSFWVMGNTL